MKNFKRHLCLFISVVLCLSMLAAGTVFAAAPEVTFDGCVATLNSNGCDAVNKIYVGYFGTEDPGNINNWGAYQSAKSRICIVNPEDGSNYVLKNEGYYVVLVNYTGNVSTDLFFKYQNTGAADASVGAPKVSNSVASNKAVIDFNGAHKINKVYYGFIGSTATAYTNYYDYIATASDKVVVSSVADGQSFDLAKVGYYRFIVSYSDGYTNYDAVFTLRNEIAGSIAGMPRVTVDGFTAALDYNGATKVNKMYVAYMGTENPGDVLDWATYTSKAKKLSCAATPADGYKYNLKDSGYYVFLVNYDSGSTNVDTYYPVYLENGMPADYAIPRITQVAGTNEAELDYNDAKTINKVFYGYIGTENTEYVDYYDYYAKAADKVIDASATDGKTYGMSKVGFYRFIVSYNNGGNNLDAVYTIENTVAGKVEGIPAVAEENGVITLDYNGVAAVNKMYVGYMGTENPGAVNDWTTFTEKRQNSICVATPADGYAYPVKGDAGFYTVVINYTNGSTNVDTYYTLEIREALDANYGKPYVTQLSEGSNDIELSLNNAAKVNKVYYGYIGESDYAYVDYYDYVKKATNRVIDAEPTEGEVYRLGEAGYYRFIINYSDSNNKNYDAVYTVCVAEEDPAAVSDAIYNTIGFVLDDMADKEELEAFEFDAKGQEIYDILKAAAEEVYALKDEGFIVSKQYVRSTYSAETSRIVEIVESMTEEERDAFETEINKLNAGGANELINLFDVNVNFGK